MDVDKLVEDNMKLVYYHLNRHDLANDVEATSAAMEGLVKAAKTYNKSKDIKFSTYASVCIYNSICHYLRTKYAKKNNADLISLEDLAYEDSDTTVEDCIGDERYSPYTILANRELASVIQKSFIKVLNSLPNQVSKDIIIHWQKSNYTATQVELASITGVSQAHVSRTLSAFRHRLKKEMEDYLC